MQEKMRLFTVGPVNMYDYTLTTAAKEIPYFRTAEFSQVVKRVNINIKKLLDTGEDSKICLLTSSGTGAMESAICTLNTNKKVLVVNGGSFGDRFVKLLQIHNIGYDEIKLDFNQDLTAEVLRPYKNKNYFAFLINIHETSIGKYYSPKVIKDFCSQENCYLFVDAISSFCADSYSMADIGADITIISSQKALALHPGLSIVAISSRYYNSQIKNAKPNNMYFDLNAHIEDGERGQTPYTPALGIIHEFDERLQKIIDGGGVDSIVRRTKDLAEYFRAEIVKLGFSIPQFNLSNCLTPIFCKNNNATQIFEKCKNDYNLYLTPCGGENKNKLLRVGHIGNISKADLDFLFKIIASI